MKYTTSTGETFDTITIPKGTLLFRGIDVYTDKPHPEFFFTDLFGSQDKDGYYCVDPHENKFFYPAPFVSDSVNRYAIHVVFHTNYDLEVVILVNPSKNSRSQHGAYVQRCSELSNYDMCGKERKNYDPCLSPSLLHEFPHIQGFIAIAEKDTRILQKGQFPSFLSYVPGAINMIHPFVVSNSRGIQGIPEIVLFPYHARPATILEKSVIHPHSVPDPFAYAIQHRAKLNYFPLVYITEKGFYSFKDLLNPKKRMELAESERENINFDSPLTTNMMELLNAGLENGLYINNVPYSITIDLRTGFYVLDIPEMRRVNDTIRKISIVSPDASTTKVVPFHYPAHLKKKIHASLTKTTEEALEGNLNRIYSSYSKYYVFEKGNPDTFRSIYKMEMALPRTEFEPPKKRYTRKSTVRSKPT
jgi:hypothetical protein